MDDSSTIIYNTLDEGYDFFITDKWGENHHFKILSFMVPSGLLSDAIEVNAEASDRASIDREPRLFQVLSDFDADVETAELRLKAKIQKGINIKYLTRKQGYLTIHKSKLAGRFHGDYFEVDGLKLTHEEFIQTISCYEGWHFTLKFDDDMD